jgi:TonB family protein
MKDALADLRQRPVMEDLTGMKLDKGTARAKEKKRSIITAEAEQRSGGIDTSGLTRDSGEVAMAGHDTTRVEAPQGAAATGGGEDKPSRSIEEVQLVFDKNKGAIYAIYNRILRRNPTLSGKVVLELTIAPSGEVTECTVVSSELKSPTFLRKLVARVKFFRFQAKDVDPMVVTYPIDFLPSS